MHQVEPWLAAPFARPVFGPAVGGNNAFPTSVLLIGGVISFRVGAYASEQQEIKNGVDGSALFANDRRLKC